MQKLPRIFIPEPNHSQQSKPNLKSKPSNTTTCKRLIILIVCILLLLLFNHSFFSQDQPRVYIKKCDVYDCSGEVRAVGRKGETVQVNSSSHKLNDTERSKNDKWELQKIVWMYRAQTQVKQSQQKQLFLKLNNENTKYIASLSGYQIRQFSLSTYSKYLSKQSLNKINQIRTTIQNRKQSVSTSKQTLAQITQNEEKIYKHLLTYLLLLQHGGLFMDESVTIVQQFETWLEQITSISYINIGDKMNSKKLKPKCFSFFENDYSSLRLKANVMREYEFERKLVALPGLEEGFLACEKGSEYLAKLVDAYVEILIEGKQSKRWQLINKDEEMIGKTNPENLYQDGHLIASHIVLQERQAQLLELNTLAEPNKQQQPKSSHPTTPYTPLAIDSFSLITINNNLGPHKFRHIFLYQKKCYSYLTKLSLQQMSKTMGKVRFIAKLTPYVQWKLGRHLIEGSTKEVYFAKGSFMEQYFLRFLKNDQKEFQQEYGLKKTPQIITFPIKPQQNLKNPLWHALPNTLWVIWDKDLQRHSKPIIQLCYFNLKKSAEASNFTIKVVSNNNIEQFISKQLREKIHQTIQKAKQPVSSQTMSDFWRLAIMYQNGGVYVDASTFTTHQNFDFIRNITRIPSHMLWNRYGSQPQAFIFWNSLLGCPADWNYDFSFKTKVQWHLSYQSNFIAAIKRSEFVKEWLEVFMEWITLPYQEIYRQMTSVGMEGAKWTKTKDRYLLVMDAVKYVVGRREKIISTSSSYQTRTHQSAADYYKIWSLPGQMIGQQKFRGQYNFESRDYRLDYMDQEILNLYKTQYTWQHAEQLLGSFDYQTKFFGLDLRQSGFIWDNFYRDNAKNFTIDTFEQVIHPESVFGKLLLYRDRELAEKLIKYYNEMAVTRLELKVEKMTGL